jgi:poly(beta-D-mannuronate) lyase
MREMLAALALVVAAVPVAPAAAEPRPGIVLVDPGKRAAALRLAGDRAAVCRARIDLDDPALRPFRRIDPPGHHGSDRRVQPLALAVAAATADHLAGGEAGGDGVRLLVRWARAEGLTELAEMGQERSNTRSVYTLRRVLLPLIAGHAVLRERMGAGERELVEGWLGRLVRLADGPTGGLRSHAAAAATSNRNNHRQLGDSVLAAWAALTGDDELLERAARGYRMALAQLTPEGALPLELARGRRALWYQRHALASLVTTAEIAALQGLDLYGEEVEGRSLHDAVRFLLDGIDAARSGRAGPALARLPPLQDLGFLDWRGPRHYMAFAETYLARFGGGPEGRRLRALLEGQRRPLVDEHSGGNTTCLTGPLPPRLLARIP